MNDNESAIDNFKKSINMEGGSKEPKAYYNLGNTYLA